MSTSLGKMQSRELVEAGAYPGKVESVEVEEMEHGPTARITFMLGGEAAGKSISGLASVKLSGKSKLANWAQTLLGRSLEDGEELTEEMLLGRKCRVHVTHVFKGDQEYDRVEVLSPLPSKKTAPPVVLPEEDEIPF